MGFSYIRFNQHLQKTEYLAYGGANDSMWTNNSAYFERSGESLTFEKKKRLHLKQVCWMNPFAVIEQVPIPKYGSPVAHIFFYHEYEEDCRLNNILEVYMKP